MEPIEPTHLPLDTLPRQIPGACGQGGIAIAWIFVAKANNAWNCQQCSKKLTASAHCQYTNKGMEVRGLRYHP